MSRIRSVLLFTLLVGPAFTQASQQKSSEAVQRSRAAASALLTLYNPQSGLFNTTGWWNSANALTALADEARATGDLRPFGLFPQILVTAPKKYPGFLNEYYDDEGWWALAWIDVYELAPKAPGAELYLQTARSIFNDMAGGWDDVCGGGIWWSKERKYKNAIANELFLSVAAKLSLHTRNKDKRLLLGWADREWRWFSETGMMNAEGLINDGLDSDCKNNGGTTWTYNQGVVLGGLAALSRSARRSDLLPPAQHIALAAVTRLTDRQGVLHEPCEPDCGEDGVSFKGIFNRNLAQLQAVAGDARYVRFLETNAEVLWRNARTPRDRFSTVWTGPATEGNAGSQASALDALNAAALQPSRAKGRHVGSPTP